MFYRHNDRSLVSLVCIFLARKLTICAMIVIKPIWRMRVDLPPIFGPVRIMKEAAPLVANNVSFGIKLSDVMQGCFPSFILMNIYKNDTHYFARYSDKRMIINLRYLLPRHSIHRESPGYTYRCYARNPRER